tara:strand:- start:358 stop:627 length:270 start_codon:yes stop_codon:yes gene_type:complete
MVEYGDVGCDGFDYADHPEYGRLSFNPEVARYIRWKGALAGDASYHVPRVISELFTQALDSANGTAGGRSKHDLMLEMIGWRNADVLGS